MFLVVVLPCIFIMVGTAKDVDSEEYDELKANEEFKEAA